MVLMIDGQWSFIVVIIMRWIVVNNKIGNLLVLNEVIVETDEVS